MKDLKTLKNEGISSEVIFFVTSKIIIIKSMLIHIKIFIK